MTIYMQPKLETAVVVTRLMECEAVIERGIRTFVDVGNALLEIRDGRLYRDNFATFEDYCRERWGMSRIHAHRMMEAANVTNNLLPIGNILPATETQARPLTSLSPDQQIEAWKIAVETAPNGKVTQSHVQSVVDEIKHKPHVANNSGNNEWYTPPEFIAAAREVLGRIDLDPASSETANKTVKASLFYSVDNSGLDKFWAGRVWMNPPYSSDLIGQFSEKFAQHYSAGDISEGIVLVNNATETAWFQSLMEVCACVCFPQKRIRFYGPEGEVGAPLQGQAILYFGKNAQKFVESYSKFGKVLYA